MTQDWKTYRWEYRKLLDPDDRETHCIGMEGNLDTIHDAQIIVHRFSYDDKEAKEIAKWIVKEHNKMVAMKKELKFVVDMIDERRKNENINKEI